MLRDHTLIAGLLFFRPAIYPALLLKFLSYCLIPQHVRGTHL